MSADIHVAYKYNSIDGVDILSICMLSIDKQKVDLFVAEHEGTYSSCVEDGEEYPDI